MEIVFVSQVTFGLMLNVHSVRMERISTDQHVLALIPVLVQTHISFGMVQPVYAYQTSLSTEIPVSDVQQIQFGMDFVARFPLILVH